MSLWDRVCSKNKPNQCHIYKERIVGGGGIGLEGGRRQRFGKSAPLIKGQVSMILILNPGMTSAGSLNVSGLVSPYAKQSRNLKCKGIRDLAKMTRIKQAHAVKMF